MDHVIETIRAAIAAEATSEARTAGAVACRAVLASLGEPAAVGAPTPPLPPIASMVAALRGVPPDRLLDLAIERLRAALPAGVEAPRVEPLKFHIVSVPKGGLP